MTNRFVTLSWIILECKLYYHSAHLVHPTWKDDLKVSNNAYAALEEEYRALAKHEGLPPVAADMEGFDESIGACRLVLSKYEKPKPKEQK